jgi:hypothetical protein
MTNNVDDARLGSGSKSLARISGLLGVTAVIFANITAILTHIDEIRQTLYRLLGINGLLQVHYIYVTLAIVIMVGGYLGISYWIYSIYLSKKSLFYRSSYVCACTVSVLTVVYFSSHFYRPVVLEPLLKTQVAQFANKIFAQQVDDPAKGGFRFSQTGASTDAQAWTTAQSLAAVLVAEADISVHAQSIRNAFSYLERVRIKEPPAYAGWGYQDSSEWGVTEIDSWVAIAYIYSLRSKIVNAIWDRDTVAAVLERLRRDLSIIAAKQHNEGGWGPIYKTSNPRHMRTFSTVMAVWALVEARRSQLAFTKISDQYDQAIKDGAIWLLQVYQTNDRAIGGWWPNPMHKNQIDEFPGLTAQVLYVLSRATKVVPSLGTDPQLQSAYREFLNSAVQGKSSFPDFSRFSVGSNQRVHDSDRYLEGLPLTVEQSTFLWFPWTVALTTELIADPLLTQTDRERAADVQRILLSRSNELVEFVRKDPVLYPTAEALFAIGIYLHSIPVSEATPE